MNAIDPLFSTLPLEIQKEKLELLDRINRQHLHCDSGPRWDDMQVYLTHLIANKYLTKKDAHSKQKHHVQPAAKPTPSPVDNQSKTRRVTNIQQIDAQEYFKMFSRLQNEVITTFADPDFTETIIEAAHQQFGKLKNNAELLDTLITWIQCNCMYLPLGEHLITAFENDMKGESLFFQKVMAFHKVKPIPEAQSQEALKAMRAFLSIAAAANDSSLQGLDRNPSEDATVVILSVKNGAGGHTAPSQAMEARLKESGYKVKVIHFDTDLTHEYDPFRMLGITFEDGTPMTKELFSTRWKMQKQNKEVSKIVDWYVSYQVSLKPSCFTNYAGWDLIQKKIIPLKPSLIITTCAYHWTWKALAYRLANVKTLLVASDVFFHTEAMKPWYRQLDIIPSLRNLHFTTMTDDYDLVTSEGRAHDEYYRKKYPGAPIEEEWESLFTSLSFDDQITVLGAPINPSFDAVTEEGEILTLRKKWEVPEEAVVACISRGKLGYTVDLTEALEGYRTKQYLSRPLQLHVVCGENLQFYEKLCSGEYNDLGPNITIIPQSLLDPKRFAEIRAISIVDDIKAGGASTFEGWYLISKGARTKLLLTPGPELWWELSNCWAMEKWGVGSLSTGIKSKIEIIEEIIVKGIEPIKNVFPDWKPVFDKIVAQLCNKPH